jgi:Carboxypeptidase regulatory-like domain
VRYAAIALLGLLLAFLPAFARASNQAKPKPYALIFGTVWDPDGHPLYGVQVKIRRADEKKVRWELYSNHTGEFAQRVPAGKADYVVWADVKGYKLPSGKKLKPGSEVTVHIDNDERSDIGLHLDWY